ncbi:MAG: LysR family transcriptional regulator [Dehalococcoidia bacterium]|nr:LysR family transcriptional regulator [Dehalococcoidia bacterium]
MEPMQPCHKLWLEQDGKIVMSDYRVRLLELVAQTGSLSQAAQTMGLSYRRAWGKVKELEANLGIPLVASEAGGAGGGHTALTPQARQLVNAYRRFQARVAEAIQTAYDEELGVKA